MSIRIPDEQTIIGLAEDFFPAGIMSPASTPFSWFALTTLADNRTGLSGERKLFQVDGLFNVHHSASAQRLRVNFYGTSAPTTLFTTNMQVAGDTIEDTVIALAGNFGFGGTPAANLMTKRVGVASAINSQNLGAWAPDSGAANRFRIGGDNSNATNRTQVGDYIIIGFRSTEITQAEFDAWDMSDIFGLWTAGVTFAVLHATPTQPEDGGGGDPDDGCVIGDPVLARRLCVYHAGVDASVIRNAALPLFSNPSNSAVFIDPVEQYPGLFTLHPSSLGFSLPDPPSVSRVAPIFRAIANAASAEAIGALRLVACWANSRGIKGAGPTQGRTFDENFSAGDAGANLSKCVGAFMLPVYPTYKRRMPGFPGAADRFASGGARFTDSSVGGSLKRLWPNSSLATDGHLCEGWLMRAGNVLENLYWIEPLSAMQAGDTLRAHMLVFAFPNDTPDEVTIYGTESDTLGVAGSPITGTVKLDGVTVPGGAVSLGTTPTASYTVTGADTGSTTSIEIAGGLPLDVELGDACRVIRAATGAHYIAEVQAVSIGASQTITLRDALPFAIATGDVLHFGPIEAHLLTIDIEAADRSEIYFGMGIEVDSGVLPCLTHGAWSLRNGVVFGPVGQGGTGAPEQDSVQWGSARGDSKKSFGMVAAAIDFDAVIFYPATQQADPEDTELLLASIRAGGWSGETAFHPGWEHDETLEADWHQYALGLAGYAGSGASEDSALGAVSADIFDGMPSTKIGLIMGYASDDGTHPSYRAYLAAAEQWWPLIADAALPAPSVGGGGSRRPSGLYAAALLRRRIAGGA